MLGLEALICHNTHPHLIINLFSSIAKVGTDKAQCLSLMLLCQYTLIEQSSILLNKLYNLANGF